MLELWGQNERPKNRLISENLMLTILLARVNNSQIPMHLGCLIGKRLRMTPSLGSNCATGFIFKS